jgi:hypothetical protein
MTAHDFPRPHSVREADLLREHDEFERRVLREGGVTNVAPIRQRSPDNYDVIDRRTGESHGIYDTLDEARGCAAFDRLDDFEIWHGDHIVEESAGYEFAKVSPPVPVPTADDRAGIVWWNGLTAADRRVWFARSGCASAADAWACYKTWGEVEVIRNDPSHTLDLSVALVTMEDSAEVAAIVNQIEDHPALFAERFLALERRVSELAAREVL